MVVSAACALVASSSSLAFGGTKIPVAKEDDLPRHEYPVQGTVQALLESEARIALAKGDYPRAWNFFWRLTQIDPYDLPALRECGRIAHAMGKFPSAVDALGNKRTATVDVGPAIALTPATSSVDTGAKIAMSVSGGSGSYVTFSFEKKRSRLSLMP